MTLEHYKKFELNRNFPYANEIKYRISRLELAIKYTKHTVQLHQNKKKLIALNMKLENVIFQHNKFDIFDYISEILDKELPKRIAEFHKQTWG